MGAFLSQEEDDSSSKNNNLKEEEEDSSFSSWFSSSSETNNEDVSQDQDEERLKEKVKGGKRGRKPKTKNVKNISDVSFSICKNEVNLHLSIFFTKFSCHPPGYSWHSDIPHRDINLNGFASNNRRNIKN
jgi:hypothetical protein